MKRKIIVVFFILLIATSAIYAAVLNKNMRQKLEGARSASVVYDRNGHVIGNLYFYRRVWVPISNIPAALQKAVVAIEDSRFYSHNGIDLRGMARAGFRDIFSPGGTMEGGSTITQQLAKIALLTPDRTITRKIQDIMYAFQIEKTYSKKEILELYLNSIYLAHGNVGVEAAARYYFGKSVTELNLAQSALIAGVIKSPENYSPVKHPARAQKRRNIVLKRMLDLKMITAAQYKKAAAEKLGVVKQVQAPTTAGYFLDYVGEYLEKYEGFTGEQLRFGGYKIYTTLDLALQKEAENVMRTFPGKYTGGNKPQGALITLDPATGEILAMAGGRDYGESQYNRSTKSYRQLGSAIKPFVFAAALEKGYTAASIMEDQKLSITLPDGTLWSPENYDHIFRGKMTLREALRDSVNTIAVQLVQDIGVYEVAALMERMGINSLTREGRINDLNLAPLALGGLTKGVTPLQLAGSYTAFANQGIYSAPQGILKVVNKQGKTVKRFKPLKKRVLSPQNAYIMTMLMKDVIERGTGIRAKLPGEIPAAGKTGTTSDYTNAWFAGYTPEFLTVIWLGNDRQDQPMRYKNFNVGSSAAAGIWGEYMQKISAETAVTDFEEPPGIVWANVNPDTGKAVLGWFAGNTYKEVFDENNIPGSSGFNFWHNLFRKKTEQTPAWTEEIGDEQQDNNDGENGLEQKSRTQPEQTGQPEKDLERQFTWNNPQEYQKEKTIDNQEPSAINQNENENRQDLDNQSEPGALQKGRGIVEEQPGQFAERAEEKWNQTKEDAANPAGQAAGMNRYPDPQTVEPYKQQGTIIDQDMQTGENPLRQNMAR